MIAGLVLGLGACVASAGSINLAFNSFAGGSNIQAGHLFHEITSGSQASVGTGTYQIVELTKAPPPDAPFTPGQVNMISAILANAAAKGWIDGSLQADAGQTNYLGRMGAIQAAIWDAMDLHVDIDDPASSDAMRAAYQTLLDNSTFDPTLRLANLRAVANPDRQDMLYIVPLPPAV